MKVKQFIKRYNSKLICERYGYNVYKLRYSEKLLRIIQANASKVHYYGNSSTYVIKMNESTIEFEVCDKKITITEIIHSFFS